MKRTNKLILQKKLVSESLEDGDTQSREDVDNADEEACDDEEQDEQSVKAKRNYNGRTEFEVIKKWITGERATEEQEDIDRELFELARDYMSASGLKKIPGHVAKETDFALWKLFRTHTRHGGATLRVFKCPLFYRCGCRAQIRITKGNCHGEGFIFLEKSGTHDLTSHENDKSKYLKFKHIEALHNAVSVAPTVPATAIRRNLALVSEDVRIDPKFLRSIQHQVRKSRSVLTVAQLEGYTIGSSFGALSDFVSNFWINSLITRHNDEFDSFHFDLFRPFVIGHDIKPERDIVHINITSPWFMCNVLRQIASGWIFQLNADGTFGFCRHSVDMIGFGVNSVGGHNHPLCWSLIPKSTEGEVVYAGTYQEFEECVMAFLTRVKFCDDADCAFCSNFKELLQNHRVKEYLKSKVFKERKLPVDTAQCDSIVGFGNFTREVFDMNPNQCKNHLLGELHRILFISHWAWRLLNLIICQAAC
jgi:hypothetical protein